MAHPVVNLQGFTEEAAALSDFERRFARDPADQERTPPVGLPQHHLDPRRPQLRTASTPRCAVSCCATTERSWRMGRICEIPKLERIQ